MNSVKHLLYADDLQIYTQTSRESLLGGMKRLSAAARAVLLWASDGALSLNAGKTKAIIFGFDYNINFLKNMNLPGIEIRDGVYVPFDDTVTNLGVVMDSKLTWEPQVDAVSRKINRALYGLKLFRSCTTEVLRKQLVGALVLSHLDYCFLVYLDVTTNLQIRLQRLQNSCVRYVCGVSKYEHISPYRRKLQWLDLRGRREYFAAVLLYKLMNMGQPVYLAALSKKIKQEHQLGLTPGSSRFRLHALR